MMCPVLYYPSSFEIQYESRHFVICACKSEQVTYVDISIQYVYNMRQWRGNNKYDGIIITNGI